MKTIEVRGLVLREYEAGESDKRLLLLCKEHGRLLVNARGARKPKSKYIASAQLFVYSDFVLAEGRGFYSVNQAQVIESFYDLRTDYDRLSAAHIIVEVCEKTLLEASECDDLLLLTLKSLQNLTKSDNPKKITGVFLMRFFSFHGLEPRTDECVICNRPVREMNDDIRIGAEGSVCGLHNSDFYTIPVSKPALSAISFILQNPPAQAFKFNANENVLDEIHQVARLLWMTHFERNVKSWT